MSLMRIFMYSEFLRRIKRRRHTTVIHRYRRDIYKEFLCPTDDLLEIQIAPNKENHIARMVKAGSESSSIFTPERFQ